jgi:predicted alpha/beta hydrolase family esterase
MEKINCMIIHGSPRDQAHWVPIGDPKRWQTWIKTELEKRGIETYTPTMPDPVEPRYSAWKEEFEKLPVNENSILVGHSAGGAFLPRWLGENQQKVRKLILIAPGKNIGDYPNAEHNRELYDFEISPSLKERVGEIVIITSPEEPSHRQKNVTLYKELLGARVLSIPGKGHFVYKDMGTNEFPELLEEILK